MLETLIAVFYEATTLDPPATLSLEKVRKGYGGFSLRLKIERKPSECIIYDNVRRDMNKH